jgi:hypothetical protein
MSVARAVMDLFADFPPGPESHFRICYFGAALGLIESAAAAIGSFEEAAKQFPFLVGYNNELADRLSGLSSEEARLTWSKALAAWEEKSSTRLPLRALRQSAGLELPQLLWLLSIGLAEEDGRFGALFEALQSSAGQHRPTLSLLRFSAPPGSAVFNPGDLLSRLVSLGVLEVINLEASRQDWQFRFPSNVWEVLRCGRLPFGCQKLRHTAMAECPPLDSLVLPPAVRSDFEALPALIRTGAARTIILRGPRHNGRRTVLKAIARSAGKGLLEMLSADSAVMPGWQEAGIVALLLDALPAAEFTMAAGEATPLPELQPASLPAGIVAGLTGTFTGERAKDALVLTLDYPGPIERRALWERACAGTSTNVGELAASFRITSGAIARSAAYARGKASLKGKLGVNHADVLEATRAFGRHDLEILARHVPVSGSLGRLCAREQTLLDLESLARHCRHREALPGALERSPGGRPGCGVRALFTGPTGTGKTLAARLLAGTLRKDLYRLELSSVVNKFIGETEKNLNRLFDCAEELDVILLLDEGDALMTRRTDVASANDRYANLETNFLLQRLESFQGILIVTTNARDRIDPAFERRMDVVVEFGPPSADERWQLWQSHLPSDNCVAPDRLAEVASECELTGGQIHNAVIHASLLALDNGGIVTTEYLDAAVRREYIKRGNTCPLRP